HDEECYYIAIEEYEEYQKKSSIFQTLVKIGTYKWNGETYEMINKTKELEDSEEEEENKRTNEEQENTKQTIEDTYEKNKYEEKDIKRPRISSPIQHSENSEDHNFQNIITPEKSNTTTNTNTGTNTPSTQGTFNRLFSNPQTPPQVLTPPIQVVPPVFNMANFSDQQYRNEQIRLQRLGEIDIEYFYGKDSENPIEWI